MIYDIPPINKYYGNGECTKFDFDFYIENENQLLVYLYDKNDIKQLLKNGIDYKINELKNNNGSFIIFPLETSDFKILSADEKLALELSLPISQETQYSNSSSVNYHAIEYSFDYLTRLVQILSRKLSLCLRASEFSQVSPDELIYKIFEAQNSSNNAALSANTALEETRKYLGEIEQTKNRLLPATYDSIGLIKPDNSTTFTDLYGTLHSPKWNLFDIVQKDHILTLEESKGLAQLGTYVYKEAADRRYGYEDFYNKCLEEYKESQDNTEEIEGITLKINSNGHKFYDIKDKDKIDKVYTDTGVAWYYGIDEENKRIFLPRISDVVLTKKDTIPVIGNGKTLGLTNGILNVGLHGGSTNTYLGIVASAQDAYDKPIGHDPGGANNAYTYAMGVTQDSEKSGIIADLSKKETNIAHYTYMVVGNVFIEQEKTNIVEVTTSKNDTIPLFTGQYFDFKPNHISWVEADTYLSGKIYESTYNELVNIENGSITKYGSDFKVIKESNKLPDVDYSMYWIINTDNQTFKTPSKISYIPYNPDTKTIPVVGNGMTLGFQTLEADKNRLFGAHTSSDVLALGANFYGKELPLKQSGDGSTSSGTGIGVTSDPTKSGLIADVSSLTSNSAKLYFKVANAIEDIALLNAGEVMEAVNNCISKTECSAYIVESYQNGDSGYRIYSDGYCEQWGFVDNISMAQTVFLLKEYSDTNYVVTQSPLGSTLTPGNAYVGYVSKSASSFIIGELGVNSTKIGTNWKTCGYLKEGTY